MKCQAHPSDKSCTTSCRPVFVPQLRGRDHSPPPYQKPERKTLGVHGGSEGANGGKRRPEWVRGSERGQDVLRRGQRGSEWVMEGEVDGNGRRVREWAGTRSHRGLRWPEGARGGRGGQLLLFLVRDSEWRDAW